MSQLLDPRHEIAQAQGVAAAAAATAGCEVRVLTRLAEFNEASEICDRVWQTPQPGQVVPAEMARALSHAGNYVSGVFVQGRMVGAAVGFLGISDHAARGAKAVAVQDDLLLHSHVVGLLDGSRSRGMGFAVKQHQRVWCIERGVTKMEWTFDPLVRRNAYFNLHKLGAVARAYHANFYGETADLINSGEETDRLVVMWSLPTSPAAPANADSQPAATDDVRTGRDESGIILDEDHAGRPLRRAGEGPRLYCKVPEDIMALRAERPAAAREWRIAVRETLGGALQEGYRGTGMSRDGWYELTTT